ncbi:MAG: hypothetical protein KIT02_08315 [Devosia sp.]|uniref:hypothetical protein n=1 Tax=Devosia sp. TaxID=1871048 RepID=UPI0024CB1ECD|nr:hypothetical protein [Devosia sp.]UYO01188.1 MAG: hypothetical protein KIT02_08315 [Devosia sp.]
MKSRSVLPLVVAVGVVTLLFLPADSFAEPLDISTLDSACIATELKNCVVITSGRLNQPWGDAEGAPMLAWQTQSGFTDVDGVLGGFVLLTHRQDGWEVLDSGFDGHDFSPPMLGMDGGMLHISGYTGGTGAYNVDRLYVWEDTGAARLIEDWIPVDMGQWREAVGPMLPEGLEIWKGVDFDFSDWFYGTLDARTPLWRADDGNCCPTGGWATIRFEIDDQHRLMPVGLDYVPNSPDD